MFMRNFKQIMFLSGLGGALVAMGLTGCTTETKAKESGRSTAQVDNDKRITAEVTKDLTTAPVYKFPDVQVNTYDRTVQLSGFVGTPAQKHNAGEIARSVAGVGQVINDLVVKPEMVTPTGRVNQGNATYQGNDNQQNQTPNQSDQQLNEQKNQRNQSQDGTTNPGKPAEKAPIVTPPQHQP
jgi:hyperosmotically inducible periplasmic protein